VLVAVKQRVVHPKEAPCQAELRPVCVRLNESRNGKLATSAGSGKLRKKKLKGRQPTQRKCRDAGLLCGAENDWPLAGLLRVRVRRGCRRCRAGIPVLIVVMVMMMVALKVGGVRVLTGVIRVGRGIIGHQDGRGSDTQGEDHHCGTDAGDVFGHIARDTAQATRLQKRKRGRCR
jgi:hypothetical protein